MVHSYTIKPVSCSLFKKKKEKKYRERKKKNERSFNNYKFLYPFAISICLKKQLLCSSAVLLLGVRVATAASMISRSEVKKAWLVLAWVSTVAGNLTLLGSAANLIVCEQARKVPFFAYTLSFWRHLKFGVPSTLIVTAVGLMLITS